MGEHKDEYIEFCNQCDDLPIFFQPWWLDAVTSPSEIWDVALAKKSDRIVGCLPYIKRRAFRATWLSQPKLTPYLGPWVSKHEGKTASRLSHEKEVLTALIKSLPDYHYYAQKWHVGQQNWLPFFWQGFDQTSRYTYRLGDLSDLDSIWKGFQENIRREIRKAKNREGLVVESEPSLAGFYEVCQNTYKRQNKAVPFSFEVLEAIEQAANKKEASKLFLVKDSRGQYHAGVYIVWDKNSAYYLIGGGDPALRKSGAASYAMWEAIQHSAAVTKAFDFEGSMVEPIERFFRGFGAEQQPYMKVTRATNKWLGFMQALRTLG